MGFTIQVSAPREFFDCFFSLKFYVGFKLDMLDHCGDSSKAPWENPNEIKILEIKMMWLE